MEIFDKKNTEVASVFFDSWYENVVKSNFEPMKKVAKTLAIYKSGIINIIKYGINNAKAERFNGAHRLNHIVQGYRNFDDQMMAILFYNGKLDLFSYN